MKAVILAAGQGTRLRPLTDRMPKCMVPFNGKPIIDHILETMRAVPAIGRIVIVDGYKRDVLRAHCAGQTDLTFCTNKRFEHTNMVASFFCAEDEFDDDLVISYADIVYRPEVLGQLVHSTADLAVIIDQDWRTLWEVRMEDPLQDAETLRLGDEGQILELGKRPKSLAEIQGQYVGLIKISRRLLPELETFYHNLDRALLYDGKDFDNMYMTSFIQLIIDHLHPVHAEPIRGGWLEIDSTRDLERYHTSGYCP